MLQLICTPMVYKSEGYNSDSEAVWVMKVMTQTTCSSSKLTNFKIHTHYSTITLQNRCLHVWNKLVAAKNHPGLRFVLLRLYLEFHDGIVKTPHPWKPMLNQSRWSSFNTPQKKQKLKIRLITKAPSVKVTGTTYIERYYLVLTQSFWLLIVH